MDDLEKLKSILTKIVAIGAQLRLEIKSKPAFADLAELPRRIIVGVRVPTSDSVIDFPGAELRLAVTMDLQTPPPAPRRVSLRVLAPELDPAFCAAVERALMQNLVADRPDAVSEALAALRALLLRLAPTSTLEKLVFEAAGGLMSEYSHVDANDATVRRYIPRPAEASAAEKAAARSAAHAAAVAKSAAGAAAAARPHLSASLHPLLALAEAYDPQFTVVASAPLTVSFVLPAADVLGTDVEVEVRVGAVAAANAAFSVGGEWAAAAPAMVELTAMDEASSALTGRELEAVALELAGDIAAAAAAAATPPPDGAIGRRAIAAIANPAVRSVAALSLEDDAGVLAPAGARALTPAALLERLSTAADAFADATSADVRARTVAACACLGVEPPARPALLPCGEASVDFAKLFPAALADAAPPTARSAVGLNLLQIAAADLVVEMACDCHETVVLPMTAPASGVDATVGLVGTAACPKCDTRATAALTPAMVYLGPEAEAAAAHGHIVLARFDKNCPLNSSKLVPLSLRPSLCACMCSDCGEVFERTPAALLQTRACPSCGLFANIPTGILPSTLGFVTTKGTSTRVLTRSCQNSMARSSARAAQQIRAGEPLPARGTCKHHKKSFRWFRFPCCGLAYPCDECHDIAARENPALHGDREPCAVGNAIICGFCSRQFGAGGGGLASKTCVCPHCKQTLNEVSRHTRYWEAGKGTRDKGQMRKNDKRKYRGDNKVLSRKALRRQAEE